MAYTAKGIPPMTLRLVDSPDKVADFWEWLTSHHDYIAADTETTGLDWWSPKFKVRLFQFGDVNGGWAIPFNQWRGLIEGALKWLATHRVRTVWHNLSADYQFLLSEDIKLDMSLQEDTFVWASLCGFAEDFRGLKNIGARTFGPWVQFGEKLLKSGMTNAGWGWDTVPMTYKPYTIYGTIDPIITAMYYESLGDRKDQFRWHHSLEIASIENTARMARTGLAVDTIYAEEEIAKLQVRQHENLALLKPYGITSVNAGVQIAKVFEEAGVMPEIVKMTETGLVSVDKNLLAAIDHPTAKLVMQGRGLSQTRAYLESMLRSAEGVLGRHVIIHPEIRSIEARTGRMSVANPALQQLPSPDDDHPDSYIVRKAIVARDPDHYLVGADFGQIELRIFASLNSDENLMEVLRTMDKAKAAGDKANSDFFVIMGRDLYEDPGFVKSDPRRKSLKGTTYATMYAGGEEKIAETAGVPQREIHETLIAMRGRYSSFKNLGEQLIKPGGRGPYGEAINYILTPTGRRFAVAHNAERRKLMNYATQGHSAEILKIAIQNAVEAGLAEELMLPVHDELILSVPKGRAKEATATLVEAMNAVVRTEDYGIAVQAAAAEPAADWAAMEH